MDAHVKRKNIQDRVWGNGIIRLPDSCAHYFEKYDITIVEYPHLRSTGIFVQNKATPDIDIVSYTVKKSFIRENILIGFKKLFEELDEIDQLTTQGNLISCCKVD